MSIPKLKSYPLPTESELPVNKVKWQLTPSRAALLIHDMQAYFLNFWQQESLIVTQLVENIRLLRDYCHQCAIPVFYSAQPSHQSESERALLNDMWGLGLTRYPAQHHISALLTPAKHDIVLTKWRYSAFHRCDFEERLREQKRDQLIICGVYAHIGCLTTATDAFMRDIQAFMIGDAVADFSLEDHLMALRYIARCSGKVLNTQHALAELGYQLPEIWDRQRLLSLLKGALDNDTEEISDDDNLLDYGLDSIRIMSLISQWRQAGHHLDFISLVKQPTLKNWLILLNNKR